MGFDAPEGDTLAAAAKSAQKQLYRKIARMERTAKIDAGAYVYFTFLRPFAELAGVEIDWTVPRDSLDLYPFLQLIDGSLEPPPGTPVETVENVIDLVDLILVMSVNPGFGGQSFISAAVDKIARLRAMAGTREIDIEVDGGITPETAPLVVRAGANALVAGSAVFRGGNPDAYRANIAAIRNAAALARGEAA